MFEPMKYTNIYKWNWFFHYTIFIAIYLCCLYEHIYLYYSTNEFSRLAIVLYAQEEVITILSYLQTMGHDLRQYLPVPLESL